jgi:hypothetical protein
MLLAIETSFGQTDAKTVFKQQSSIEQIKISEDKLQRLSEKATKYKELYDREMISRREWEEAQAEAENARLNLAAIRSDDANAERLASLLGGFSSENEYESVKALLKNSSVNVTKIRSELKEFRASQMSPALIPLGTSGGYEKRTNSFVRFAGSGYWSLKDAGQIQAFFQARFRRPLPISAFGQSETHNRLGFDHHNAMDVAIHPDSVEGRALVAYLESRNIPFAAFRQAIPGSATGPHIHIGVRSNHFR